MGRILTIIMIGVVTGVALVAGLGAIGMRKSAETQRAAVVEREWAARRVGQNLPPTLQLWRDGYETGLALDKWSNKNRVALRQYLSDWDLFPAKPTLNGPPELRDEALAYLERVHEDTIPQYLTAERDGCQVWIDRPQAKEEL